MTDFVNNFDLNKAHHDSFFKKAPISDIEKGGVGSGRKIGQTSRGEDIMDNADNSAHRYFTKENHQEASKIHKKLAKKNEDESKKYDLSKYRDEDQDIAKKSIKILQDKAKAHLREASKHEELSL